MTISYSNHEMKACLKQAGASVRRLSLAQINGHEEDNRATQVARVVLFLNLKSVLYKMLLHSEAFSCC